MKTLRVMALLISLIIFSGNAFAQSFIDNGNGTVTDNDTGLIWQQTISGTINWETALAYCDGLLIAGNTDWRLPNRRELVSLVAYNSWVPSINTIYFPTENSSTYWTSTTYARDNAKAWVISFREGSVWSWGKTIISFNARCVRGG